MKIRERRAPKRLEENEDTSSGTTCPSRSQPPGLLRTKLFCELANAGSIGLLPLNAPRLFTYVGAIDVIRRIECRGHLTSGVSYRGRRQLVFFFRLPAESKYSCTMKETLVRRHCHVHAVTRMSAHNVCRSRPGIFLGAMHVCSPPHLFGRSPPTCPPLPFQVWLVFRRYRDFVTLRQRLKSACQGHHQKHGGASPVRGDPKSHTPVKRLSGRVGLTPGPAAAEVGLTLGAGTRADRIGADGDRENSALIARVETILSEYRFPSRLALGRSFSLKQERRKALHAFLAALVSSDRGAGWRRQEGAWHVRGASRMSGGLASEALARPAPTVFQPSKVKKALGGFKSCVLACQQHAA